MISNFAQVPTISIAPEKIFDLGPLAITNTYITGLIGTLILLAIGFATVRKLRGGTAGRGSHAFLWMFESLYDTTNEVIGDKSIARKVLPYAVTLMFFFLINNWLGILPGVGSISYGETHIFRGVAADMNTTFALSIMSILIAQAWAIKRRGFFGNLGRYFINPLKDPLHSFEGMLEIVAEFSRTLALSLRIFGNVFGGEVLLLVIAYLLGYFSPLALPLFYVLELFVGAVQAYVFFMLTIAFISLAIPEANDPHGAPETVDGSSDEIQAVSNHSEPANIK